MKFEREYTDGNGRRFKAVVTIGEGAGQRALLEKAILALAARARDNMRKQTTALGGAVHCIVHPIRETKPEKCPDNPSGGPHSFTPDLEYDSTGETVNCEFCGEAKP